MKVVREKPCQRRHHRITAPMRVTMPTGEQVESHDWSLGGIRLIPTTPIAANPGDTMALTLELPFQGFDIAFSVEARLLRHDEDSGETAFSFETLSERAHDLMKHFINDLIRGKMATIDDTICRIDVPVTPISTQPDPNPQAEITPKRWPIRTIVMSALYVVLGVSVFTTLGFLFYSNMTKLEVPTAVVTAPLQTVSMPVDGMLQPIKLYEGAQLLGGEPIAEIIDPRLRDQIRTAELDLTRAENALIRAEQRMKIEAERLKIYQVVSRTDRDIAAARLEGRRQALAAADAHFARISTLAQKGLATAIQLDEATKRQGLAAAQLRQAELGFEQTTVMAAAADRRHYNHKEFVTDLDMSAISLAEQREAVDMARLRLLSLREAEAERILRAPFAGRIVKAFQAGAVSVVRNTPLALVEADAERRITAFLRQEEVIKIGLNDEATVFFPALNRRVPARITKIDRSSAFVDGRMPHYSWRDDKERTAAVSLKLEALSDPVAGLQAGLPAVVIFDRRTTNELIARVMPGKSA